jgi:hypothetical protein
VICEAVPGVVATYLHGSGALGGFVPGRSDVDVLVVCRHETLDAEVSTVAANAVRAAADPCPGRGVEPSVVSGRHAREPRPPWPFLLHVTTDPADARTVLGIDSDGDPDLLMHYVVCRSAAIVVHGPAPGDLIGEVPRRDIVGYLHAELSWALEDAPEAYGVLNACRALAWVDDGKILSKVDGARHALARGGPQGLIAAALRMQRGDESHRRPSAPARRFVIEATRRLDAELP